MLHTVNSTEHFKDWERLESLIQEAFPGNDKISAEIFVEMAESENVDFFALYDQDVFIGFVTMILEGNQAFLFFFAIEKDSRCLGFGSMAIEAIRQKYRGKSQYVDLELLDPKATNNAQRIRRKDFYLRNGYKEQESR